MALNTEHRNVISQCYQLVASIAHTLKDSSSFFTFASLPTAVERFDSVCQTLAEAGLEDSSESKRRAPFDRSDVCAGSIWRRGMHLC